MSPLYNYRCVRCQSEEETLQEMGDVAPECCGQRMEKQYSPFVIKGKSARRRWCENWTPDSNRFTFGDWRDHTEEAEAPKIK